MTTASSSDSSRIMEPRIPHLDVSSGYRELQTELDEAYRRVMSGGSYILGSELSQFETAFATYCEARHCLGVANGLDALQLILLGYGVGVGDEVIVPGLTFIATWLAISHTGAQPVPVDVDSDTCNIDPALVAKAITSRTKAIVAVHLFGQVADMTSLRELGAAHGLRLIEDAAQAHGATWNGRRAGSLGDAAAFSFYPAKNLGAFGDGGAVVSDDEQLMRRIGALRNYGSPGKYDHALQGFNSRLDPLQAAFLRVKLSRLDEWNARRRKVANLYQLKIREGCILPHVLPQAQHVWHQYVVRHPERDALREALGGRGVGTAVHYPTPPHLTPAYSSLGLTRGALPVTEQICDKALSLPMGPHLSDEDAAYVAEAIRAVI